mmetsp:Transcript_29709/g.63017  ORF Transcript_29709/g.63017 Transcript_29709/m.63017 type:complete len:98 (-) Transcript_29709:476-769(-)
MMLMYDFLLSETAAYDLPFDNNNVNSVNINDNINQYRQDDGVTAASRRAEDDDSAVKEIYGGDGDVMPTTMTAFNDQNSIRPTIYRSNQRGFTRTIH